MDLQSGSRSEFMRLGPKPEFQHPDPMGFNFLDSYPQKWVGSNMIWVGSWVHAHP